MHGKEERRSTTAASGTHPSALATTTRPSGSESDSAAKGEQTSAASSLSEVWRTRMA
jgi:hypothetical protein